MEAAAAICMEMAVKPSLKADVAIAAVHNSHA